MGNDYLYPGELSTTIYSHVSPSALRQNQYYIAQISIETDAELYNHFGNTKDATDYITSVMAFSSAIYAKEVGIVLRIQSISLWTDGIDSDPWVTVNPSASINTSRLLFDFKDYWNRINPDSTRAAALFISGRPVPLGISYPGGLCEQSYALVTGLEYSPLISNGLVWDNYVVSHELGHLFGSPHSHEYKNIDGEPNGIDSCVTGDNFNAVPSGKVPGINTLDTGILGSRSGTIMSYCDHNYRGLKNIAPSFGNNFQYGIKAYREANLITESAASKHQSSPGCIKVETISNPPTYTPLPRSTKWNLRKTTFSDGSTLEGYLDFNSYLSSYNYSRLVYTDISGQHPLTVVGAYSDKDIKLSVDGKQDSLAVSLEMNDSLLTANDKISLFVNVGGCRLYIGLCYGISSANSSPAILDIESTPHVYSKLTVARSNRGVITSDGAMINCGTNATACSTNVQEGTVITLTAAPKPGYYTKGWSGCTSSTGDSCVLTIGGAPMGVSATFAPTPKFTLKVTKNKLGTVTSDPAGINCKANVTSCSTKIFSGAKITLTATPSAGRTFVGWTGACSGKDVCSLTMDGAKGVSAMFQ